MIGRIVKYELGGLRRSWAVAVTSLFAIGGAVLGRTVDWLGELLRSSGIEELPWLDISGQELTVPLLLLGFVIAAGLVFGRDLSDGTAEVTLTAPVKRESIVYAKLVVLFLWAAGLALLAAVADIVMWGLLALTAVEPGEAISAAGIAAVWLTGFSTLPLIGWVALRFRGVVESVGFGMGLYIAAFFVRGIWLGDAMPWNAPLMMLSGDVGTASVIGVVIVLAAGVTGCLWQMRRLDLT